MSKQITVTLPQKTFKNETARRIILQRQRLSEDYKLNRLAALDELEAIRTNPESYQYSPIISMSLTVAVRRLAMDGRGRERDEILSLLWDIAVDIEDGGYSLTVKQMRDLEESILEAIRNEKSPQEIAYLLQQYKNKIAQYLLQQLASQGKLESLDDLSGLADMNAVGATDLLNFVDYLQGLANTGQYQTLSQMFQQLQQVLEHLETGGELPPGAKKAQALLKSLRGLIASQQDLLEQTFTLVNDKQEAAWATGETDGKSDLSVSEEIAKDLAQKAIAQGRLAEELNSLGEKMQAFFKNRVPSELSQARQPMQSARQFLEEQLAYPAYTRQTRALGYLEQALDKITQQMQQQFGGGLMSLPQGGYGRFPGTNQMQDTGVQIPDRSAVNKIDKMIEELRDRSGNPDLPEVEQDYINNLLRFF